MGQTAEPHPRGRGIRDWGLGVYRSLELVNVPSLLQAATTAIQQVIIPTVTDDSLIVVGCVCDAEWNPQC